METSNVCKCYLTFPRNLFHFNRLMSTKPLSLSTFDRFLPLWNSVHSSKILGSNNFLPSRVGAVPQLKQHGNYDDINPFEHMSPSNNLPQNSG